MLCNEHVDPILSFDKKFSLFRMISQTKPQIDPNTIVCGSDSHFGISEAGLVRENGSHASNSKILEMRKPTDFWCSLFPDLAFWSSQDPTRAVYRERVAHFEFTSRSTDSD